MFWTFSIPVIIGQKHKSLLFYYISLHPFGYHNFSSRFTLNMEGIKVVPPLREHINGQTTATNKLYEKIVQKRGDINCVIIL